MAVGNGRDNIKVISIQICVLVLVTGTVFIYSQIIQLTGLLLFIGVIKGIHHRLSSFLSKHVRRWRGSRGRVHLPASVITAAADL